MDESVIRAMARMPDVPAVFGWLALDRRCRWLLRGVPVTHRRSIAFFNRNFEVDAQGRWFVQNGPQRVFVDLAYLPLLFSLDETGLLRDQRGRPGEPLREVLLDEDGNLILLGAGGPGLLEVDALIALYDNLCDERGRPIDERDLAREDACVFLVRAAHKLRLKPIAAARASRHFGFQPKPKS